MRRSRVLAALAAVALVGAPGLPGAAAGTTAHPAAGTAHTAGATSTPTADDTTIGYSPLRQNWDDGEPGLTTATVGPAGLTTAWDEPVPRTTAATPNQVYAQPIVADGQVVVVTDDNEIASYDPQNGRLNWATDLGPGWTPTPTCGDLSPHIGITSTPVYDPSSHRLYLVAKAADGPGGAPTLKIHAFDLDDQAAHPGLEPAGWPQALAGRPTNGGPALSAATSAQRAGLLLGADGALYVATASHCDNGPFVGYVARVPLASPSALTLWATVSDDDNGQAGIWQSGGGIMSDGVDAGGHPRLFVVTGNGVLSAPEPGPGSGAATRTHLSESVIRLRVDDDGTLYAADFFSPADNTELDLADTDLGSGGPVALPDSFGSAAHRHLLVVAGKDGTVRLLDRDDLGGTGQGTGGGDAVPSALPGSGVWGHAAAFDAGDGRHFVYLTPAGGPMQAYRVTPDAAGTPTLTPVARSSTTFPFGSGSPVVTSDPDDPATALVWVSVNDGGSLVAYPALPPVDGPWQPVATSALGHPVTKFSQPATAAGTLFLGTRDGRVLALHAAAHPVRAAGTDFGAVPVGGATTRAVSLTTDPGTTVRSATADGGFTAGTVTQDGNAATVPVRFAPTAGGRVSGTLSVTTAAGDTFSFPAVLRGTGTADTIDASPAPVTLGPVSAGQTVTQGVLLTNTGAATATVTGASLSGDDQFSLAGPAPHDVALTAQAGVALTVRFAPTRPDDATYRTSLTLQTSYGTIAVPITGTARQGTAVLALSSPAADLGQVQPGSSAVTAFQVRNDGDAAFVITKAGQPAPPFAATIPIAENTRVDPPATPGYGGAYAQVTARPITAMPHTDTYFVNARPAVDGNTLRGAPRSFTVSVNTGLWSGPLVGRSGCLALRGAAPAARAPAQLAACSGAAQQQLTRTPDARYHLGPGSSPWCLQVHYGLTKVGTPVELGRCDTITRAHGQTWRVDAAGTFYDLHSGLCLRSRGGQPTAGTPLVIDRCMTGNSEQWDASAVVSARGALSSGLGSLGELCLTNHGGVQRNGNPVELDRCALDGAAGPSQTITQVGAQLRTGGHCITVSGTSVLLGQCYGTKSQMWTADGAGRLVNAASRTCLTVPGDRTAAGTPLRLASCTGAAGQRWTLPSGA